MNQHISDIVSKEEINKNLFEIPKASRWFKMEEIHEIEMHSLPEFFKGKYASKTPEIYKEYRNYIINLFRENPNSYLTATTCRRHLSGDVCSILRIHSFLEFWGIINFNIDPNTRPVNPLLPKAHNYKTPVYVDASSFLVRDPTISSSSNNSYSLSFNSQNLGFKFGDNTVVLNDSSGNEVRMFYPINNIPENLFRSAFNKSTNMLNQINFIAKNFRPKCDVCNQLCELEWHSKKFTEFNQKVFSLILCDSCFKANSFPKDLKQSDFSISNMFDFVYNDKHSMFYDEKWTSSEIIQLIDSIEKNGENWEEIVKSFSGKKSAADCVIQFMQLPIKENVQFKFNESKNNNSSSNYLNNNKELSAIYDNSNPIIGQIVFFAKMFEHFSHNDFTEKEKEMVVDSKNLNNLHTTYSTTLEKYKEEIYKKYSDSTEIKEKKTKKKDKKMMKNIMHLMIYLQTQKIENKINSIHAMEKMIQNERLQLKLMDNQIISDRINLVIKKNEMVNMAIKLRENLCKVQNIDINYSNNLCSLLEKVENFRIELDNKILNLN